jgi:hypothetical protein
MQVINFEEVSTSGFRVARFLRPIVSRSLFQLISLCVSLPTPLPILDDNDAWMNAVEVL